MPEGDGFPADHFSAEPEWLPLDRVARIEASSARDSHPPVQAFSAESESGWRASVPGEQSIAIVFHEPCDIGRIRLVFIEDRRDRTQEFALRWSSHRGETHREIVRQQFNFSPSGATREVEDYRVELRGATRLELRIVPDIRGGAAIASVREFRVASLPPEETTAQHPESAVDIRGSKPGTDKPRSHRGTD